MIHPLCYIKVRYPGGFAGMFLQFLMYEQLERNSKFYILPIYDYDKILIKLHSKRICTI